MYNLDQVSMFRQLYTGPDFWYWTGWMDYISYGNVHRPKEPENLTAYLMGYADAKGEDYGCT